MLSRRNASVLGVAFLVLGTLKFLFGSGVLN